MGDFGKDWPVYLALMGFIWMVSYAIIKSKQEEKKEKDQNKASQIKTGIKGQASKPQK